MAAQTTPLAHLDEKPYKPIDPKTLTPEQLAVWKKYCSEPLPPTVTQAFADEQFRYILSLEGYPLED